VASEIGPVPGVKSD